MERPARHHLTKKTSASPVQSPCATPTGHVLPEWVIEMLRKLYVSSDGGGFYTLPTDLSSATFTHVSGSPVFDGMAATNGNLLYFVVRGQGGLIYDLNTGTVAETSPFIAGADDIAPLTGLGSPTPEPSSTVLFGSGFFILAAAVIRRKAATALVSREEEFRGSGIHMS